MTRETHTRLQIPKQTSLAAMLGTVPGKPPRKKRDWGKRIEAQLGYVPGPELRELLKWAGNRSGGLGMGHVFFESEWPAATADPKKWEAGFLGTTIAPVVEAFTETVCIGQDGSGNMYFADADPRRSEVFFHDHDGAGMVFLAGSIGAFVHLQCLVEAWGKVEQQLGRGEGELTKADFARPPLRELRAALRALPVAMPVVGGPTTDFDDSVPILAGKKLRAKPRSGRVGKLYQGAEWLIKALWFDAVHDLAAAQRRKFARETADPKLRSLRATRLYWLWHLYLFGRDEELSAYGNALAKDRSELVRRTVALMERLRSKAKGKELDRVRALRTLVQREVADPGASAREYERKAAEERAAEKKKDAWLDDLIVAPADHAETFPKALAWFRNSPGRSRIETERFAGLVKAMGTCPDLVAQHIEDCFELGCAVMDGGDALAVFGAVVAVPIPAEKEARRFWLMAANNGINAAHSEEELELGRRLCKRVAPYASENPYVFHGSACVYAALGDIPRTIENVQLAAKHRYQHLNKLRVDTDLTKVLGEEGLERIVREAEG